MKKQDENIRALKRVIRSLQKKVEILSRRLEVQTEREVDSNALQLAELIIDNSTAILFRRLAAVDPKKRKMVYVSPNISRFGYRAEDFLDGTIMFRDIVYPGDSDRTLREIREFVSKGIENYSQVYRIVTHDGEIRWVEDRTSVVDEKATGLRYHQGIVIDIHEQKEAEEKLLKSEEKYRRIVETAGEGFLLMDDSYSVLDANSAYTLLANRSRDEILGRQPLNMKPGEYQRLVPGESNREISGRSDVEHEMVLDDGRKVPVLIHANSLCSDTNEIIGNMAFITDITGQKKALQLASEVQKGLLPKADPVVEKLDIAGKSVPCEEVGGDYFDYLTGSTAEKDSLSVIIGDITGHGVDSALLMASARAFLRMRASQPGSVKDIVTDMNHHLTGDMEKSARFMTLFYLFFDLKNKRIEWIRAGHEPAMVYDPAADTFAELKGPGLALGVDRDYVYRQQQIDWLASRQIVVLTTDGICEGVNSEGEMFGKDRLKKIVRTHAAESAREILNRILQEHIRFTQGEALEDDLTLVIVKVA